MRKNIKKFISAILVVMMVLQISPLSVFTVSASETQGAVWPNKDTDPNPEIMYEYYDNITTYRTDKSYPKKEGYVFAGWYTANSVSSTEGVGTLVSLEPTDVSGSAWAKYVVEDVLTVKAQVSKKVASAIESANDGNLAESLKLRLATSTDDKAQYSAIGFKISINGNERSIPVDEEKFFTEVSVNEVTGAQKVVPQTVFGVEASKEFATLVISGFGTLAKVNETELQVTPYWETLDGTTVYGTTRERLLVSDERANDSDGSASDFGKDNNTYTYNSTSASEKASYQYFAGASDTVYLKGTYKPSGENVKFGISIRNGGQTRQVIFSNAGVKVLNGVDSTVTTSGLVGNNNADAYNDVKYTDNGTGVFVWARKATNDKADESAIIELLAGTEAKEVIWAIENNMLYCSVAGEVVLRIPMQMLCDKWQNGRYYQLGVAAYNESENGTDDRMLFSFEELTLGKEVYSNNDLIQEDVTLQETFRMVYEPITGSYMPASRLYAAYSYGEATSETQVMKAKITLFESTGRTGVGIAVRDADTGKSIEIVVDPVNGGEVRTTQNYDWSSNSLITGMIRNSETLLQRVDDNDVNKVTAVVKDNTLYILYNDTLAYSIDLYKILLGYEDGNEVQLGMYTWDAGKRLSKFSDVEFATGESAIENIELHDNYECETFYGIDGYMDQDLGVNMQAETDISGTENKLTCQTPTGDASYIYSAPTTMSQVVNTTIELKKANSFNGITLKDATTGQSAQIVWSKKELPSGLTFIRPTQNYATPVSWINNWTYNDQAVFDSTTQKAKITAVVKDYTLYLLYDGRLANSIDLYKLIPGYVEGNAIQLGLFALEMTFGATFSDISFAAGEAALENITLNDNYKTEIFYLDNGDMTQDTGTNMVAKVSKSESGTTYTCAGTSAEASYIYSAPTTMSQVVKTTITVQKAGSRDGITLKDATTGNSVQIVLDKSGLPNGTTYIRTAQNYGEKGSSYLNDWTNNDQNLISVDAKVTVTAVVKDYTLYLLYDGVLKNSIDLYKLIPGYVDGNAIQLGLFASAKESGATHSNVSFAAGEAAIENITLNDNYETEIFYLDNGTMTQREGTNMVATVSKQATGTTYTVAASDSRNTGSFIYGAATKMPQMLSTKIEVASTAGSAHGIIIQCGSNSVQFVHRSGTDTNRALWKIHNNTWNNNVLNVGSPAVLYTRSETESKDYYDLTAIVRDGKLELVYNVSGNDIVYTLNLSDLFTEYTGKEEIRLGLCTWESKSGIATFSDVSFKAGTEESMLKGKLKGKNISILGDSISTFENVSNGTAADTTNSTIRDYVTEYTESNLGSSANTYWGKVINKFNMNLLVNNSYRGARVKAGANTGKVPAYDRCENLHDNTGDNEGTNPDIIAVYIGTNDLRSGMIANYFRDDYTALLDKIKSKYPNADVFCFTLLPYDNTNEELLNAYNTIIRELAPEKGATVVDIAAHSGITVGNMKDYSIDNLHPNAAGMSLIADVFERALMTKYLLTN